MSGGIVGYVGHGPVYWGTGCCVVVGICGAGGAVRGGCNFYYSAFSCWCRRDLRFGGDWALGYDSMKF